MPACGQLVGQVEDKSRRHLKLKAIGFRTCCLNLSKIINRLASSLLLAVVLISCASSTLNGTKNDDSASVYLQLGCVTWI